MPAEVWVITRDGQPHVWILDAVAWRASGQRQDLMAIYRANSILDDVVAAITARVPKEHS